MGNTFPQQPSSGPSQESIFRSFAREYSSPECSWRCDLTDNLPIAGHSAPQVRDLTAVVSSTIRVPASCPAGITIEAEAVVTQIAKSLCRSLASTAGNHVLGVGDTSRTTGSTRVCTQCYSSSSRSWCGLLLVAALTASAAGLGAAVALYWIGASKEEVMASFKRVLRKSSLCAEAEDSPVSVVEDGSLNATGSTDGWDDVG